MNSILNEKKVTIRDEDIKKAEEMGKELATKVTTTQIRKFLAQVNQLRHKSEVDDDNWKDTVYPEILMILPRFEYQIAKNTLQLGSFKNYVKEQLPKCKTKDEYMRFALVIEATVGYFKANGGKDK